VAAQENRYSFAALDGDCGETTPWWPSSGFVEAGLIQRAGGIEPGQPPPRHQQISAATAEVQRSRGGARPSTLAYRSWCYVAAAGGRW